MLIKRQFLQLFEGQSAGLQWLQPLADIAARWRFGHIMKNTTAYYEALTL